MSALGSLCNSESGASCYARSQIDTRLPPTHINMPLTPQDHVMSEKTMHAAMNDNIKVTKCINIDESYKAQVASTAPIKSIYYTIEGCSLEHLNGKYLDNGKACNVAKYRNTRGWVIYRCALLEIPDLGIFADNCYVATSKNTGVAEALDRRADYAFNDIVNRDFFGAPDGSVQFKRRFAEMSRSGQRVINVDQTMQVCYMCARDRVINLMRG